MLIVEGLNKQKSWVREVVEGKVLAWHVAYPESIPSIVHSSQEPPGVKLYAHLDATQFPIQINKSKINSLYYLD